MHMEKYYQVTKINEQIYQFNDAMSVLSTLVIGSKQALLIDTGYGIGNLHEEVRKYTDLPLIVVDSHGHLDHTCGNYQFDEVYINEKDIKLCQEHTSEEYRKRNLKNAMLKNVLPKNFNKEEYLTKREGNLLKLPLNHVFDLGNICLETIEIPGHTKGSIAFYIEKYKIMVTSDGACPYVWLFLKESASLKTYIQSLEKLLRYDFNYFLVGHGSGLLPKSFMVRFLKIAQSVDLKKAKKISFDGFDSENAYSYCEKEPYTPGYCGVIFNSKKLD